MVPAMLESLQLPFVQRGVIEIALLAVAAGLIGTWIVLRGLAFFSHAVGTAAFPGLVLADGLAFSAHLGALGTAGAIAAAMALLARRDRERYDNVTALLLVAALATGVILASDVFGSGSNVETLLFGSLLVIDAGDIAWAAGAAAVVVVATFALGPRWLATGFDPGSARGLGIRPTRDDAALLGLVALVAIAALSIVGALLAVALMVVPAATTRLLCTRMATWQLATVALTAAEGIIGLLIAVELDAPPGAAIAVLAGTVFLAVALVRALTAFGAARNGLLAASALLLALGAAGCGSSGGDGEGGGSTPSLTVVATTTQLGDVVANIAGADAEVTTILAANTDPHDYEPRPSDVRATADAKLVFASGAGVDEWIGDVVEQAGGSPEVVTMAPGRVRHRLAGDEHERGDHEADDHGNDESEIDPHWWHDPRNVEAIVPVIRDALAAANPQARDRYASAAAVYLRKLRRLDAGIRDCFAAVAPRQRKLVTDHDAFGYFARRYRIRVIGAVIPSQTTQAQPSAGDVAELARVIRSEQVTAVFPEASANDRLAKAIARQTGATANHTLYGDTLGPRGSDGATYLAMERHNADAMVRGFTAGVRGCTISGL